MNEHQAVLFGEAEKDEVGEGRKRASPMLRRSSAVSVNEPYCQSAHSHAATPT